MRKAIAHLLTAISLLTAAGTAAFFCLALASASVRPTAAGPDEQLSPVRVQALVSAQRAATVTVTAGMTLSAISQQQYGSPKWWPQLWRQNRKMIRNPNVILKGMEVAVLPRWKHAPKVPVQFLPKPPKPPMTVVSHHGSPPATSPDTQPSPAPQTSPAPSGVLSPAQVGALWVSAGGPGWAEAHAEEIAMCESGGDPTNYYGKSAGVPYNGTQAAGLFQILGQVVAGNIFDPMVNAENAVSKFKASGDTFAQWVCQ